MVKMAKMRTGEAVVEIICSGFFCGRKKVDRCRENQRSPVLIRAVPA